MSYHKFKDSTGRVFEANFYCEFRKGVDSIYSLEDAYYLDGEKEEVSSNELDGIYNEIGWEDPYLGED